VIWLEDYDAKTSALDPFNDIDVKPMNIRLIIAATGGPLAFSIAGSVRAASCLIGVNLAIADRRLARPSWMQEPTFGRPVRTDSLRRPKRETAPTQNLAYSPKTNALN
jgi:hypothetical protein